MIDPKKDWISVNRSLLTNEIWGLDPFSRGQAWVDLLLLARWKDGHAILKGVVIPMKRGQICRSMKQLSVRWQWSQGKVKRFILLLSETEKIKWVLWSKNGEVNGEVNGEANGEANGEGSAAVTTLITIVNYDMYQPRGEGNGEGNGEANGEQAGRVRGGYGEGTVTKEEGEEGLKGEEGEEGEVRRMGRGEFSNLYQATFKKFMPGLLNHECTTICEKHPAEWIIEAFRIAAEARADNFNYVKKVLENKKGREDGERGGSYNDKLTREFCEASC